MIPTVESGDYLLRGVRARDLSDLAESMRDWPVLDTRYTIAHGTRDLERWQTENEVFVGLPATDFAPLTWALVYKGETVGFCRCVFLGTQAHIHFQVVHPDHRGAGHMSQMNYLLQTLIAPLGVERVTFELIATAPQAKTLAEQHWELAPTETGTGLTGLEVASYGYNATDNAERLKKPEHAAELIEVTHVAPR